MRHHDSVTAVASTPPAARQRISVGLVVAFAGVYAVHLLLLRFYGGALLLSDQPITGLDHETHIAQTWRVIEGLDGWGQSWVYDVRHLAGFPTGAVFDADNKGWEVLTWGLHRFGVPGGAGFNAFVLAAHLGVVPVVYVACRWFGLLRWSSLTAAAFAVGLWYFDSWLHWCWYVGMTAYDFVSYLFLLPLALFHRWRLERRGWQIAGVAVLLPLCHLVHPYAFFLLAIPMLAIYVAEIRQLTAREHAAVWGVAALTVLANAWWLVVALRFSPWMLDSSLFGHTKIATLPMDVLGLVADPGVSGVTGTRATFRFVAVVAAAVMLWRWRRRGDPRVLPLGVALLLYFSIGYFGGVTPLSHIQPYRHVGPLAFVALVPAAALLEVAITEHHIRRWSRTARATIAALGVGVMLLLARDAMYFANRALPEPEKLPGGIKVFFNGLGIIVPADYEYGDWNRDDLAAWVTEHDDGQGRFLVEGWTWGEQLTWKTDAQILGGFIWRNLEHSWANFFRTRPQGIAPTPELVRYLQDWGVRWVIVGTPPEHAPWWDRIPVLERVAYFDPFRIYRVRVSTSLFVENHGRVQAETNRIAVSGTDPTEDVVLRYHWLGTLSCRPDCRLERERAAPTKVGFLRIPAPHPADFEIINTYEGSFTH